MAICCALGGCGGAGAPTGPALKPHPRARVSERTRPALGLTEDNANLLWSPSDPAAPYPAAFAAARAQLSTLHPAYLRLQIDWAALQPEESRPADLAAPVTGCARETGPCGSYQGIAAELRAIASQQHSAGGFSVVMDILGAPAWAALPAHGCERASDGSFARPLRPGAIGAYRQLIAGLAGLARREGAAVAWWSPWNEPNDPLFITPQRASCGAAGAPLSPGVYGQLTAAMAAELSAQHEHGHLLLGELAGYSSGSAHGLSVGEFVAAVPAAVLCDGQAWSVHGYAARPPRPAAPDPVGLLEAALGARGGCAASAPILVTETGAGAPEPGQPVASGPAEERQACLALARLLSGWLSDPRVAAILQYSFRDDPAYPVGLLSADLARPHATYRMWLGLDRALAAGRTPPSPTQACT